MRALASVIDRVVKVNYNTTDKTRGKFARVAVVVDISKPLIPFIGVDGKKQTFVYEGLPSICYSCGKVGHIKEKCNLTPNIQPMDKEVTVMEETGTQSAGEQDQTSKVRELVPSTKDQDLYGPWMQVVNRRSKKTQTTEKNGRYPSSQHLGASTSQRYVVLAAQKKGENLQQPTVPRTHP